MATATSTQSQPASTEAPAVTDEQAGQQTMTTLSRWVPSLPSINLQQLNPFAVNDAASNANKQIAEAQQHSNAKASTSSRRPVLSTLFATSTTNQGPPSPSRSSTSVMFAEPDLNSNSGSNDSREGSIDEHERKRKKSHRRKTSFSVCHPPPASTTRQKLHRRPRSLLQLHKLSASERPVPAFEVIPSANFNVKLTRAITKVFRAKHGLCPSDLVVMKAEKYASVDEDVEEEEAHVIGLICKGRKDKDEPALAASKAKVCMRNGQEWEAYPLMNGGYEFFSTDEHGLGLTVRWVPKKEKEKGSKAKGSKRFNFSTISPNSRRHPVIAALSKTSLEVYDTYKMPDPTATPLSTPRKHSESALEEAMREEGVQEQCETDDLLREIITMTGIYVTFKEGWSPSFKYDDKGKDASGAHARSASTMSGSPNKSLASPVSTPPGSPQMQKRNSVKSVGSSIFRRSSQLIPGNRASQASIPDDVIAEGGGSMLPRRSTSVRGARARGDSTSTVLVHRAASNRRKQAATWRPDLLDAKHQLQETSREDLNGTPPPPAQNPEAWETTPVRRTSVVAEPLIPGAEETESGATTPTRKPIAESGADESDASGATTEDKPKSERSVSDATASTLNAPSGPKVVEVEALSGSVRVKGEKRKRFWKAISLCGRKIG